MLSWRVHIARGRHLGPSTSTRAYARLRPQRASRNIASKQDAHRPSNGFKGHQPIHQLQRFQEQPNQISGKSGHSLIVEDGHRLKEEAIARTSSDWDISTTEVSRVNRDDVNGMVFHTPTPGTTSSSALGQKGIGEEDYIKSTTRTKPHLPVLSSMLCRHWDINPPTMAALRESRAFFSPKQPCKEIFSADKLLDVPFTSIPEVCFLGRSNVGKSSLLNAIFQRDMAKTSHRAGKTKRMNGYSIGVTGNNQAKLAVLDMPGYGRGSRENWGKEITKYLSARKELKRVFLLIDAIDRSSKVRIKQEDLYMLQELRTMKIPHEIIVTKVDRALFDPDLKSIHTSLGLEQRGDALEKAFAGIKDQIWGDDTLEAVQLNPGLRPFGQLIAVSAANPKKHLKLSDDFDGAIGIDAVRWAILVATGYVHALPSQKKASMKKDKELERMKEERKVRFKLATASR